MKTTVHEHVPKIVSLFPDLADISRQEWSKEGIVVKEIEPSYVIAEGTLLDHAVFVLEGIVRMYKVSPNGREITLYRITGGECCPLMSSSILGETEYEASAYIETRCLALFVPVNIFHEWFDTHKGFRQFIFKSICGRIITLSKLLDSTNFKSIRGRIAEYLLNNLDSHESNTIKTTHDTLAIELGSAREVISRTLKQLEKENLVSLSRGTIIIMNREGLEALLEI